MSEKDSPEDVAEGSKSSTAEGAPRRKMHGGRPQHGGGGHRRDFRGGGGGGRHQNFRRNNNNNRPDQSNQGNHREGAATMQDEEYTDSAPAQDVGSEANVNAGVAAAEQIVAFFENGDQTYRVNK